MKKNADYAIALKIRKVKNGEEIDESCSKFYGAPTLPESLLNNYPEECVFFLQINCEELKDLDPDNRLPHKGYLYFFLDAQMYPSDEFGILVNYTLEIPKYIIDDFNENSPIDEGLNEPYIITFEKVDKYYEGTKLLGCPSNYVSEYNDKLDLLLQYDPLEFNVPFLSTCDGYAFVFFGKTKNTKFSKASFEVVSS